MWKCFRFSNSHWNDAQTVHTIAEHKVWVWSKRISPLWYCTLSTFTMFHIRYFIRSQYKRKCWCCWSATNTKKIEENQISNSDKQRPFSKIELVHIVVWSGDSFEMVRTHMPHRMKWVNAIRKHCLLCSICHSQYLNSETINLYSLCIHRPSIEASQRPHVLGALWIG